MKDKKLDSSLRWNDDGTETPGQDKNRLKPVELPAEASVTKKEQTHRSGQTHRSAPTGVCDGL